MYSNYIKKPRPWILFLPSPAWVGVNGWHSKTAEVNIHLPANPCITAECRMFTWTELGLKQDLQNPFLCLHWSLTKTQIYIKVHRNYYYVLKRSLYRICWKKNSYCDSHKWGTSQAESYFETKLGIQGKGRSGILSLL